MQSVCLKAILDFGDIKGQLVCLQGTRLFFLSFACIFVMFFECRLTLLFTATQARRTLEERAEQNASRGVSPGNALRQNASLTSSQTQ